MSSILDPPLESPHGSLVEQLGRLHAVIDDLQELNPTALADGAVVAALAEIERAARRLPAVRAPLVAEITARGIPAVRQVRSTAAFLRMTLQLSPGEAAAWVRDAAETVCARALCTGELLPAALPAVADAVRRGSISTESARLIGRTMRAVPAAVSHEDRALGERTLTEAAEQFDPVRLARLCQTFLSCVDPDGSLGTQADRDAQRSFSIGRQDRYGMYPVRGRLDPETGALVKAALEPLAAPQPTATERDDRTADQRNHDALRELARRALASGDLPSQGGLPATLLLMARLEDIERRSGLVSTVHGGVVPVEDVIRMSAQMSYVPIVFDSEGRPLHCGRETRLATPGQRQTVYAMDRGCVLPDCDQPAMRTQVHHFTDFAKGGRTDIDQLGLLCPFHHHRIDGWQLERRGGRVWCTPPPWIDPTQTPRVNTYFHVPELFSG